MLLVKLMEECAETTQVASKSIRFGLDSFKPSTGEFNKHVLENEIKDINACLHLLSKELNLDLSMSINDLELRCNRIEEYLKISQDLGIMDKEEQV